jgi:hypothetical protein
MKSYTELRNLYGTLSNNSSAANLTLGDQLMDDVYQHVCRKRDWYWLQKSDYLTSGANTQFYTLPADCDKVKEVTLTVGSTVYTPMEIVTSEDWADLNRTAQTSDSPQYFYIFGGQVGFYPALSSAGKTITVKYRRRPTRLSMADYTTGNVSALTNSGFSVTGSGTTWTAPMTGRYIKIATTDTAAASGDNRWYQIGGVTNTTTIALSAAYTGTTISSNTAYTIGQMPLLPEGFHKMLVYGALLTYFASVQPEASQASRYRDFYDGLLVDLIHDSASSFKVALGDDIESFNPNLSISL